jgi:hypothetical protein
MAKTALAIYKITYNPNLNRFEMHRDGELVGTHSKSGRELGRDAWEEKADEVGYFYDLTLDEHVPTTVRHHR